MLKQLRMKFVIINMSMLTVMLLIIFSLIYHSAQRDLESESIRMMQTIATDPFHLNRPDDPADDLKLPFFTIQLSPKGELLATGGGYYDLSDADFLQELIRISTQSRQETGIIEKHRLRYYRMRTPVETVLVFSDMSSETTTLAHLLRSFVLVGAFSVLIFLGISMLLARWAVRPVAHAWKQQKQFVADASHELKTPLTIITTNAGLLCSETCDDAEKHRLLQNILLMSDQMKQLIQSMLTLARTDNLPHLSASSVCSLSELVTSHALSFEGVFLEHDRFLTYEVTPDIRICGDADGLGQVIDILLDNAVKYSAKDSTTHLSLYPEKRNTCRVQVSSSGEAIPPDALSDIFQRFYRIDHARSRSGSFGLGLSIAKNIVERHGGQIWADSHAGINSFYVRLRRKR